MAAGDSAANDDDRTFGVDNPARFGGSIVEVSDSSGQLVIIVKAKITHLVPAGEKHTEVHLVSGTYLRVCGNTSDLANGLWPSGEQKD